MEGYDNFSLTTSVNSLNISKILINASFWNSTGNITQLTGITPPDKWNEIGRMIEIGTIGKLEQQVKIVIQSFLLDNCSNFH